MSSKEKSMWDSLTPEEQQEFWNGMSQSEQIAFAQAMEHPHQVQPKPDQAKGAKSRLFQQGSRPIFTYTEAMKTRAGEKKLSLYRTNFEDAGVAGDYVSPTSTNYSAHTNKIILAMALLVVVLVVVCVKLLQDKREMSTQYADQQQAQGLSMSDRIALDGSHAVRQPMSAHSGLSMSDRIALDGLAQMDRNQQQREQIEPSYPVKTPIHNTDFTPYIDAQNRRRQDLLDKQEDRLRSEMPWRR